MPAAGCGGQFFDLSFDLSFSISNANDRYKRLRKKPNNKLRSMYIREAAIGGEGDELYSDADSIKIGRALRKAGKGMRDAGK